MRHGQTLFNAQHKIQGWCDAPLTKIGIKQAEVAGKWFDDNHIQIDDAYCSTSERASDTLEIVTHHNMPYTRLKGLKEMNFGVFEGKDEPYNESIANTKALTPADKKLRTGKSILQRRKLPTTMEHHYH